MTTFIRATTPFVRLLRWVGSRAAMKPPLCLAIGVGLLVAATKASAQLPATPPAGGLLNDLERRLPGQPMTAPDGARIEIPDAMAEGPISSSERVTVRGYHVTGNTAMDPASLLRLIEHRTGELSLTELHAVAVTVTAHYRARGYPLARAYLPKQEIKDGIVLIAVLEGRYDRIATRNAARISDERVARTLQNAMCDAGERCEGALINRKPLERGLMLLNDTPGAQAAARLSPGTSVGTSTLTVDASANRLLSGALQLDNGGNYYSGVTRAIGTFWVNSPARIGDQITVQGVASAIHGNLYYGALGYGVPLGYSGLRFSIRGSYLNYHLGDSYESLDAHGTVRSGDAALFYPFIRSRAANLTGSISYGERRFHDDADAMDIDNERRITDRTDLGLSGDFRDHLFGAPALNMASLVYTAGRLELDGLLGFVDALSAGTAGDYGKWGASYARLQSIAGRTNLLLRVTAQGTSGNLDSYEKFALGGPDSVRAYPPGETLADEAVLYSIELRQGFEAGWARALEAVLFYDRARGDLNSEPWSSGPNRVTLSGVGAGLNYTPGERLTIRSSLAFRGNRRATAAPDSSYQYSLSMNVAF